MNFCPTCGAPVELRTPQDDHRERHVCTACHTIHYQNPKIIAGAIPEWTDGRILLCRRAIEPRHGLWTLPAGFMENGETTTQAAARETLEEANARIEVLGLYAMYNLPYIDQVQLLFRARLLDLDFSPGVESLEVELFSEEQIPWDTLAFRPISYTLKHFFDDRRRGDFKFRSADLERPVR
ncbi:MAG: NUDIX hydrolase [Nitrosomonadales bacterium]|nr:NUDIX hydrolase [Nitrosomonadales bacterium]